MLIPCLHPRSPRFSFLWIVCSKISARRSSAPCIFRHHVCWNSTMSRDFIHRLEAWADGWNIGELRALTGIHLQVLQHHQHHPPGCSDTLHFPASEHETPGRSSFETIMLRSGFELAWAKKQNTWFTTTFVYMSEQSRFRMATFATGLRRRSPHVSVWWHSLHI